MSQKVLILQSDPTSAQVLSEFFTRHGDQVWQAGSVEQVQEILRQAKPDLAFLDLHMAANAWLNALYILRKQNPSIAIVITNKRPDVHQEFLAREQGIQVFLREPFTPTWIERALDSLKKISIENKVPKPDKKLAAAEAPASTKLPKVRVPMRIKITLPYAILAVIFVAAAAYVVSRYVLESMEERFTNQLIDAGKLSADWMVQEENRLLETERMLAYTDGMAQALTQRDSNRLRQLALPGAINNHEEAVEVLDLNGASLLSIHHKPGGGLQDYEVSQGETLFAQQEFVQKVLTGQVDQRGDKYAGLIHAPWGSYFYIAGPVPGADGKVQGAILVGKSLDTLVAQLRQDILAQLTLYDLTGRPLASTLLVPQDIQPLAETLDQAILQRQDSASSIRDFQMASATYSEILGPWEARGGEDLGIIGVALGQNFFIRPRQITSLQAFITVLVAFMAILLLGLFISRRITQPLAQVVNASQEIAEGNFKVKVPYRGDDEVMVLAHAFNYMVTGLQEGSIYRDLLGRTVSPQVRETLREAFATGTLKLEGHNAIATVLMSDIRSFTTISEREEPATVLKWLNEYFGELVPIVTRNNGVVDKFEGDALLAFFGVLPVPLPPQDSAYQACRAALEMLEVIEAINARRQARSEPPLRTGIGVNTGTVTAGGLGTADRLNYTVIGDTVNSTQRMQELTRGFGESGVVIGENTLNALGSLSQEFYIQSLGAHAFKGKSELIEVFHLQPGKARPVSGNGSSPVAEKLSHEFTM